MPKLLKVTVLKDEDVFLEGEFEVPDTDYPVVVEILPQMGLDRAKAAGILSGFMHANDVGETSEEMGKLAMVAAVFMLETGATEITIPLTSPTQH